MAAEASAGGAPSAWALERHYEVVEPRILGYATFGPVLRARDLRTGAPLALRVYDTTTPHAMPPTAPAASPEEPEQRAIAHFKRTVEGMQRVRAGCEPAVATLLGFSRDASGRPAAAADGRGYLAAELGMFSLEQLGRDSQNVGHRASVAEVRETLRALLAMLRTVHRSGCVLARHAPRQIVRFASGWKLTSAALLRPAGSIEPIAAADIYQPPELLAALSRGAREVARQPGMDVWSVAVACLELALPSAALAAFEQPLTREDAPALFAEVREFSEALHELMVGVLLHADPSRRSADLALQHRFFSPSPHAPPRAAATPHARAAPPETLGTASTSAGSPVRALQLADGALQTQREVAKLRAALRMAEEDAGSARKQLQHARPAASATRGSGGGGGEVERLHGEIRRLLQAAGSAEVERQWLAERVAQLKEGGAAPAVGEAEGARAQLEGELREERRARARSEAAAAAAEAEAKALREEKRRAEEENEALRGAARGKGASSEELQRTYAEADRRVKQVRQEAEAELSDVKRKAAERERQLAEQAKLETKALELSLRETKQQLAEARRAAARGASSAGEVRRLKEALEASEGDRLAAEAAARAAEAAAAVGGADGELRQANGALRREVGRLEKELRRAGLPAGGDARRLEASLEEAEGELEWMEGELRAVELRAEREVARLEEELRRAHGRAEAAEAEARALRGAGEMEAHAAAEVRRAHGRAEAAEAEVARLRGEARLIGARDAEAAVEAARERARAEEAEAEARRAWAEARRLRDAEAAAGEAGRAVERLEAEVARERLLGEKAEMEAARLRAEVQVLRSVEAAAGEVSDEAARMEDVARLERARAEKADGEAARLHAEVSRLRALGGVAEEAERHASLLQAEARREHSRAEENEVEARRLRAEVHRLREAAAKEGDAAASRWQAEARRERLRAEEAEAEARRLLEKVRWAAEGGAADGRGGAEAERARVEARREAARAAEAEGEARRLRAEVAVLKEARRGGGADGGREAAQLLARAEKAEGEARVLRAELRTHAESLRGVEEQCLQLQASKHEALREVHRLRALGHAEGSGPVARPSAPVEEGRALWAEVERLRAELREKDAAVARVVAERDEQLRALSEEKDRKLLHMRDALIESEEQRRTGARAPIVPTAATFTPALKPFSKSSHDYSTAPWRSASPKAARHNMRFGTPDARPAPHPRVEAWAPPVDPARLRERGVLKVHLKRGTGLKSADLNGKSDPYVIVSCGGTEKKSRPVLKTLNPEFNEVLEFEGSLEELVAHRLLLKVFDKDRLTRDDPLGEVSVSLDALRVEDSKEFIESLSTQGSLVFGVEWSPVSAQLLVPGTLHIHLSHATDLKAKDRNGFSDPYVKLTLCGTTHKSKTIKKTLNPRWDEDFEFKGTLRELISEPLQLNAFDYDFASKDDPLGHASVDLRALERTRQHAFEVPLSDNGGKVHLRATWTPVGGESRPVNIASSGPPKAPHVAEPPLPPKLVSRAHAAVPPLPVGAPAASGRHAQRGGDPARLRERGVLKVHLKRGTGLKSADLNGKSDPYVIVSCGGTEKKSRPVLKTLNPEFNEVLEFEGSLEELVAHRLLLKVFDKDRLTRDDPLGEVSVSLDALRVEDSKEFIESLSTQGSLVFGVEWSPVSAQLLVPGTLHIHLSHATDLKAKDRNGFSDPYVKLTLCGTTHKSKTIKKTLNPRWDEDFEFKGTLRELISEPLQLNAFDYDFASKDDPLGHASVDLRALERTRQHAFEVPLSDNGGKVHLRATWTPVGGESRPVNIASSGPPKAPHVAEPPLPPKLVSRAHAAVPPLPVGAPAASGRHVQRGGDPARLRERGVLKVHLKRGTGLKSADLNGKSDPYVIVSCGGTEKKSRPVLKTLNPEFNEVLEFEGSLEELVAHRLLLKVFDKDRLTRDDPLGEVSVSLDALRVEDSKEFIESLSTQGSLVFGVEWSPVSAQLLVPGTLHIHLSHATDLKAKDRNGFSDPYVKLTLCGTTHKSKTIKKTLNPRWDEDFEFKGTLRELISEPLQLNAFDYDFASKDDPLGHASVDLLALERTRQHAFEVPLSDNGGKVHLRATWTPVGGESRPVAGATHSQHPPMPPHQLPSARAPVAASLPPPPRPTEPVLPEDVARPPPVQVPTPSSTSSQQSTQPWQQAQFPSQSQSQQKLPIKLPGTPAPTIRHPMPPPPAVPSQPRPVLPPQQRTQVPQARPAATNNELTDRERRILQRQQALIQQQRNNGALAVASNIAQQQQQQQQHRRPQAQAIVDPSERIGTSNPPSARATSTPPHVSSAPHQRPPPLPPPMQNVGGTPVQAAGITVRGGPKKKKGIFG
ncbi:hypothetical protein AB1Y20_007724 [Prymnesium parvum]|uniref:Non-specific serine/threonine protein kinase n=1 Tax=Prymnesium parvum TaxID=97485 RepID=A0AB34IYE0_PRYPA